MKVVNMIGLFLIIGLVCALWICRGDLVKAQEAAVVQQAQTKAEIAKLTREHTPDWARINFAVRVYDEYRRTTLAEARLDKKYGHLMRAKNCDYPADYELAIYRRNMADHLAWRAYKRLKSFDREIFCRMNDFEIWSLEWFKEPVIAKIPEYSFPDEGSWSAFYEQCAQLPVSGDIWDMLNITTVPGEAEKAYDKYKKDLQRRELWVDEPKE